MTAIFTDRDELRSKLRDLLVSEVRQGLIEGDRAKEIAQDIIDELELADDGDTPLQIFDRIYARYPQELQALKDRIDAAALTDHDQDVARRMAELIVQGRFDDAIAISRGQALIQLASTIPSPTPPMADDTPSQAQPQAASPAPQAPAPTEPQAQPQAQATSPASSAPAETQPAAVSPAAPAPTIGQQVSGAASGAASTVASGVKNTASNVAYAAKSAVSSAAYSAESKVESGVRSLVTKAASGATSFIGGLFGKLKKS